MILSSACIRALQPVYVSRTDPDSRKKTIAEIKRRANSGGKWPHVVIFPEGMYNYVVCWEKSLTIMLTLTFIFLYYIY